MIINYVLGQAGSGKSTFITRVFPKEDNIVFNVGEVLRSSFSCLKKKQTNKNVWSFANPLVYSMFKHHCKVARDYEIPLVTDGLPRNSKQLMVTHRYLTTWSHKTQVIVNVNCLHINREEQIRRITERNGNGSISEYQLDRIEQSREDLDGTITALGILRESESKHKISYKLNWYSQHDGHFHLERSL